MFDVMKFTSLWLAFLPTGRMAFEIQYFHERVLLFFDGQESSRSACVYKEVAADP
jgi:hypothetical protein